MITKELFLKCISNYQKYDEWEDKLADLGLNFWEQDQVSMLKTSYLDMLEYCCKDNDYNDYAGTNISYFMYETEFGKKADEFFITEPDGTEIKLKTAEDLWNYLVKLHPEIEDKTGSQETGDISDGYHTFNDLYKQRMILSAALCNTNRDKCWKSKLHEDGTKPFDGNWFIVGFDTDKGSYTYHYELEYWDLFKCKELPVAKHWDGHTSDDVGRLLFL